MLGRSSTLSTLQQGAHRLEWPHDRLADDGCPSIKIVLDNFALEASVECEDLVA